MRCNNEAEAGCGRPKLVQRLMRSLQTGFPSVQCLGRTYGNVQGHFRLSFCDGNGEMEGGAMPEFAIEPDTPTLHFNKALGNI